MSLTVQQTSRFRRDVKRVLRQGADISQLEAVVSDLIDEKPLDQRYRDHALVGNWRGFRECHIQPDWLLIYRIEQGELQLARTGSHAELF